MKRFVGVITIGLLLVLAFSLHAKGADDLPAQVLARLSRGEAEQARQLLEKDELLPARIRALLLYGCDLAAAPQATPEFTARAKQLAAAAEPGDVPLLRAMQAVLGPRGAYLESLIDAGYDSVERTEREQLLELCASRDPVTRAIAVASIASWIAPLRAKVSNGDCLEDEEQRSLQDATLVETLIARLPERSLALDRIPPELAVGVPRSATALHALVLIEEPALAGLHAALPAPGTAETIAAITSAIDLRQRRFPESTWADARPKR